MDLIRFSAFLNKNGNILLLDIDPRKKQYRYGYFFRYASRELDIVLTKKQMKKLVERLERLEFERID